MLQVQYRGWSLNGEQIAPQWAGVLLFNTSYWYENIGGDADGKVGCAV